MVSVRSVVACVLTASLVACVHRTRPANVSPQDREAAIALSKARANCSGANEDACVTLGGFFQRGELVKKDLKTALRLYQHACDRGDALACGYAGSVEMEGGSGIIKDAIIAAAFFERACTASFADACFNLGALYAKGDGVKKDAIKGVELQTHACDLGDAEGCAVVGAMFEDGDENVPKDLARAISFYEKSCAGGDAEGCYMLGYQLMRDPNKDIARARELLTRACKADFEAACHSLAELK
jgi:TPR repeat protein